MTGFCKPHTRITPFIFSFRENNGYHVNTNTSYLRNKPSFLAINSIIFSSPGFISLLLSVSCLTQSFIGTNRPSGSAHSRYNGAVSKQFSIKEFQSDQICFDKHCQKKICLQNFLSGIIYKTGSTESDFPTSAQCTAMVARPIRNGFWEATIDFGTYSG